MFKFALTFAALACGARASLLPRLDTPPEALCALSLVPPLFGGVQHPRLFIAGAALWLDQFLRLTPAAVTLLPRDTDSWRDATARMAIKGAVVLFVGDTISALEELVPVYTVPLTARVALWTALPDGDPTVLARGLAVKCLINSLLVLTAANGTAVVYSNPGNCDGFPLPMVEVNRWDPARGWQLPDEPLLSSCWQWRPPADGVYSALVEPFFSGRYLDHWENATARTLRDFSKYHGFPIRTQHLNETKAGAGLKVFTILTCRLDVLANPVVVSTSLVGCTTAWGMTHNLAVVPRGFLGRHRGPLAQLVSEFSPGVWCATAAAVLAMAVWRYADPRNDPPDAVKAVMQAVAPLLGQPSQGMLRMQRPSLSCCWLFVAVVLTASYQGQLLSDLTVRVPAEDITSVEQLVASNLTILVHNPVYASLYPLQEWGLGHRVQYTEGRSLDDVMKHIAHDRAAAVFVNDDGLAGLAAASLLDLSWFVLPSDMLMTHYSFMCASPVHAHFRKFIGRRRAAGLEMTPAVTLAAGAADPSSSTKPQPLGLAEVAPVFYTLVVGLVSAGLLLLLERLECSLRRRRMSQRRYTCT